MLPNHEHTSSCVTRFVACQRMEATMGLHAYHLIPTRSPGLYRWAVALRNRRRRQGRDTADACRAGRKRRSRDEGLITLRLGRVTGLAGTRKGVAVRVGCRKAIRECLHEDNDQVLFVIR